MSCFINFKHFFRICNLFRNKKKSLANGTGINLLQLPLTPLLKCLRFLDETSLDKVAQTCSTAQHIIDENRRHLVEKEIFEITIQRFSSTGTWADTLNYKVMVQKRKYSASQYFEWDHPLAQIQQLTPDDQMKLLLGPQTPENESEIKKERAEWERTGWANLNNKLGMWMKKELTAARIWHLSLQNFYIDANGINLLENLLKNEKIRIAEIVLLGKNVFHALIPKESIRFLKIFKVEAVRMEDSRGTFNRLLAFEEFREYISSLDCFFHNFGVPKERTRITIDSSFWHFPPVLYIDQRLLLTVGALRNAIRAWKRNELKIKTWAFNIGIASQLDMATALAEPGTKTHAGQLVFENCLRQSCYLRLKFPHEEESVWSLSDELCAQCHSQYDSSKSK